MAEAWARTCPPTGFRPSAPAKDIAPGSDWTWLDGEGGRVSDLSLHDMRVASVDVLGHEDADVEFLCEVGQLAKVDVEFLLALVQFSTALIVAAEEVENAVDDQQPILPSDKQLSQSTERFLLIFAVVRAMNDDIFVRRFWVDWKMLACRSGARKVCVLSKRSAI